MSSVIALKVDVDTFIGTRDGVPALLETFEQYGIQAKESQAVFDRLLRQATLLRAVPLL